MITSNLDIRYRLIERDTVEVITLKEIREILSKKRQPTAYIGFEASGPIHLGYMLVANKIRDLQAAGFNVKILIADLHTKLNKKLGGDLGKIRRMADYFKDCFLAMGVNKERTEFILGSSFQLNPEYFQDLLYLATYTSLRGAKRAMDMASRKEENPEVSKIIYPLMQIEDMVALDVDVALAGIDQRKIHMLGREILPRLAKEKGIEDYRPPSFVHLPLLVGLRGGKMSKSIPGSYILIHDPPKIIQERIKKAYCPPAEIKDNPILQICRYILFRHFNKLNVKQRIGGERAVENYEQLEELYANSKVHPQDLKETTVDLLTRMLIPIRASLVNGGAVKTLKELELI